MYSCGFLTPPEKGLGVLFYSLPSPAIVTQKLYFEPRRDKMSLSGVIHWNSCSWSKLRFSFCSLFYKCVALMALERIPVALTHCLSFLRGQNLPAQLRAFDFIINLSRGWRTPLFEICPSLFAGKISAVINSLLESGVMLKLMPWMIHEHFFQSSGDHLDFEPGKISVPY